LTRRSRKADALPRARSSLGALSRSRHRPCAVDEAQDTSAKQWEIIEILVAEFLPAARVAMCRTLFAVGDNSRSSRSRARCHSSPKCAITSARTRQWRSVATEKLDYSFRSAVVVLNAVDAVFKQPGGIPRTHADPTWTVHQPLPGGARRGGDWELIGPDERYWQRRLDAPFDTTSDQPRSSSLPRSHAR
jgi:ATP-dependent helicase/nuclease subunit A